MQIPSLRRLGRTKRSACFCSWPRLHFYSYLKMPLTGGFAALLLATMPGFFTFCRSSLSEISASTLIALAFMFAYLGLKQERRWKIYLSAIFLGLSLNVRVQSFFFAPLLLAMALIPK